MVGSSTKRVAIVYPGDRSVRDAATTQNNRFARLFDALAEAGIPAEPAVYHDDFRDEVFQQLSQVDAALVWVNPIEGGRDRTVLDAMLLEIADAGVYVSAHPAVILAMGTKQVLYDTRAVGWGSDVEMYRDETELRKGLLEQLGQGRTRVLKQYRGHSGIGIWMVSPVDASDFGVGEPSALKALVRARHAQRGSVEETLPLEEFLALCRPYFSSGGSVIDQAYQPRLDEGMFRCYLVHDEVAGIGFQAINALYPAPPGKDASEAPQPGPRLYYPPTMPEAQPLKRKLEVEWLPALLRQLAIDRDRLPVLWDADFLLGPRDDYGNDTYVLCEINVSSVAPFPDSAIPVIVDAMKARLKQLR